MIKAAWYAVKWVIAAIAIVASTTIAFDHYLVQRASAVFEPRIQSLEMRHNEAMERMKSMDNKLDILIQKAK